MNRYDTPPSEEFVMDDSPMSITDFPQESRESVTGLLWLGFLEETVDVLCYLVHLSGDSSLAYSYLCHDIFLLVS